MHELELLQTYIKQQKIEYPWKNVNGWQKTLKTAYIGFNESLSQLVTLTNP